MFNPKVRITFVVENSPLAVRFVPHTTDPTKIMVKGIGDGPAKFCEVGGIGHGVPIQGANFTMVEVTRDDLFDAIAQVTVEECIDATAQMANDFMQEMDTAHEKCPECGCDDGTHFQFCGSHVTIEAQTLKNVN